MAESCCNDPGCGCNATSLYAEKDCPVCGRKLRVTGDLQQIKLKLTCPGCGYQSAQLSMDEVRVLID